MCCLGMVSGGSVCVWGGEGGGEGRGCDKFEHK